MTADRSERQPESSPPLFVVSIQYAIADLTLAVPTPGIGFFHHTGVKVLVGYRDDGSLVVLTESEHNDKRRLDLLTAAMPSSDPSDDDPELVRFMDQLREWHRGAATDIVGVMRWVLARPGGHLAVRARQSARYLVRGEREWRPLPMRRLPPLTGLHGRIEVDEAWRQAIQTQAGIEWHEPIAHIILRDAREQMDSSPRSATVLLWTALEVGLKDQPTRLSKPVTRPPKALPWEGSPRTIRGDVADLLRKTYRLDPDRWRRLPLWVVERLEDGRQARVGIAHYGKAPPDREALASLLRTVQDILYLLDFQAGHDWAESYISYLHGDTELVFGAPVFVGELPPD